MQVHILLVCFTYTICVSMKTREKQNISVEQIYVQNRDNKIRQKSAKVWSLGAVVFFNYMFYHPPYYNYQGC